MPVPAKKGQNPFRDPRPGEDARTVAWLALRRAASPKTPDAQEMLGQLAERAGLDPRDRAFAFEIMQGIWRTRSLLDAAMDRIEGFSGKSISPEIRDLLRVGAYQHFHMDRVPCHALVHATVEVARVRLGGRKAGFCNALLQRMLLQYPGRGADLERLSTGLPAAERFSMPDWIVRLVGRAVGEENRGEALAALNRPLPLYVRCNPARMMAEEAVRELAHSGIRSSFHPDLAPLCLEVEAPVGLLVETDAFRKGGLFIQDASSQLVAELVASVLRSDEARDWTVLDYCAAPGGKATYLAAQMEGRGRLIAHEVSAARQARLRENIARLGFEGFVEVVGGEADGGHAGIRHLPKKASASSGVLEPCSSLSNGKPCFPPSRASMAGEKQGASMACALQGGAAVDSGPASRVGEPCSLPQCDLVLVDAPCSGLGTLRRHPEIRWRINYTDLKRLARLQREILERAARFVKPGGWLVYGTCSFAPEENQEVVESFLKTCGAEFRIMRETRSLPQCVASPMDEAGWLCPQPHLDAMDSARAVRMIRTV
jgi:16S rRNA (cytosine967-C5)-methyltransferase